METRPLRVLLCPQIGVNREEESLALESWAEGPHEGRPVRRRRTMKSYAVLVLGAVALVLMVLNLYGVYQLVLLFTQVARSRDEDPLSTTTSTTAIAAIDYESSTHLSFTTPRDYKLKYQFNRTSGTWTKTRIPIETSTHRTTHPYRTRRPTTRWHYDIDSSTTPPTPPPPPPPPPPTPPSTTPTPRTEVTQWQTPRTTTRVPFSIKAVNSITTYREDLHHHHRHHHSTRPTETVRTSTIKTLRPALIVPTVIYHEYDRANRPVYNPVNIVTYPPATTTTHTPLPSSTRIIVTPPTVMDDDDEYEDESIQIEREDLIGAAEETGTQTRITVNREDLPEIRATSDPRVIVTEGSTTRVLSGGTTEAPEVTTNVEEEGGMTLVTALMDIGRGEWFEYRRPLDKYHSFMENVNMVIYTDASSVDFVIAYREEMGLSHKTKVYNITLEELPLYRHIFRAQKIIEDELKNPDLWREWDPQMQKHPEAKSAEYNIVVNSKTYFLYNASLVDPFHSDWFVWLDAGYGHGDQTPFPVDNHWTPRFPRRKISLIKARTLPPPLHLSLQITPDHDNLSDWNLARLYRQNWSVISGGFLAGERHAIGQLYGVVHRKFVELLNQDRVDDDQTILVLVIKSHPQLFNVIHGDWFDAFKAFPSVK